MDLTGRVALVTGGGRRIGAAIAAALGRQGMRVAVHYHASAEDAEDVVRAIDAAGGEGWRVQADLLDPAAPEKLVADILERFGCLDVLVNSAASMERTPFGEITVTQWERVIALNTRAPFFLAQAAARHMQAGAAIINIADIAAYETWPSYLPHGLSKNGVAYATKALARVLAPRVRVNAVAPGVVLLPEGWDPAHGDRLASTTPLRRLGSTDDIVQAVLYLLESDFVTGHVLTVDGGRLLR